jgi:histidyl-tRNA synthetase
MQSSRRRRTGPVRVAARRPFRYVPGLFESPPIMSAPKDFRPKARRPRVRDRHGPVLASERALIEAVSKVYEAWGFAALDTSAFEYADALGKFLPDQDRPNEGVFSFQDDDDQWVSLRYDLTAPLARFVAENFDALPKPYRRWAAGPVWRNDKLGAGRYREFWQCDADTVGTPSPAADAEMLAMTCEALDAAGLQRGQYILRVNTRRLLNGVMETIGVAEDDTAKKLSVLRAIDKLDRFGVDGVRLLLGAGRKDESGDFTKGAGLSADAIDAVLAFVSAGRGSRSETLDALSNANTPSAEREAGLKELSEIDAVLSSLGVAADQVSFDPGIVRGLEYYTGPVFEIELLMETKDEDGNAVRFGSVGGGGRYDDLVARFRGERIPATGTSIGVSRLAAALAAAGRSGSETDGPLIVLPFDKEALPLSFQLAQRLRQELKRPAEVYLGGSGPKAQLRYADKRGAPVALIIGEDERKAGTVTLKDLKLGAEIAKSVTDNKEWREGRPAQQTLPQDQAIAAVRAILAGAQ